MDTGLRRYDELGALSLTDAAIGASVMVGEQVRD
jgi:hypothetical protein